MQLTIAHTQQNKRLFEDYDVTCEVRTIHAVTIEQDASITLSDTSEPAGIANVTLVPKRRAGICYCIQAPPDDLVRIINGIGKKFHDADYNQVQFEKQLARRKDTEYKLNV